MSQGLNPTSNLAPDAWVDRYLGVLGIERQPPSIAALTDLTDAHLRRIHFENLTSLVRAYVHQRGPVPPLDPEALLDNFEQRRGGGVCYEIATMVERLLRGLGYQAYISPGQIVAPAGHLAVGVEIDGDQYLIDLGNGAPLFEPIPLDGVREVHRAGLGFRFRPGPVDGTWLQERLIHGEWDLFCQYGLAPVSPEVREGPYQHHHRPGGTWVTGEPRIVRCDGDTLTRLNPDQFETYTAQGKTSESVSGPDHFARIAAERFDLPNLPCDLAFEAWAWSKRERG